jgi:hypothetical protein
MRRRALRCRIAPSFTPLHSLTPPQIDEFDSVASEFVVTVQSGPQTGSSLRLAASLVLAALAVQQGKLAGSSASMTDGGGEGPTDASSAAAAAAAAPGGGGASAAAPASGLRRKAGRSAADAVAAAGNVVIRFSRPALSALDPAGSALKEALKAYVLMRAVPAAADGAETGVDPLTAATGVRLPPDASPVSSDRWPALRLEAVACTESRFVFNRALDVLEVRSMGLTCSCRWPSCM